MSHSLTHPMDFGGMRVDPSWLVIGIGAIISGSMMLGFPDDVGTKVLAMAVFWAFSVASTRFDIGHPYTWFGGPLLMYSIAGPLLLELGLHPLSVWSGYRIEELGFSFAMDLQFVGLLTASLVIGPGRIDMMAALRDIRRREFFAGLMPVLAVTILLALLSVTEIVSLGFTRKADVVLHGSWLTRLGFGLNMVSTCLGVYLIKQFVEGKPLGAYAVTAFFVALGLLVVFYTGQGNFLFRLLVVIFFAFHIAHRRVSFGTFLILCLVMSVFVLLMGGLKLAAFLPDSNIAGSTFEKLGDIASLKQFLQDPAILNDSTPVLYGKFFLVAALGDEFMTAGNNLAMLVRHVPDFVPFQYGRTIINDIVSASHLGFLGHGDIETSSYVYNQLFFPSGYAQGKGQGFTVIGVGYFNFGMLGVIVVMGILGAVVRSVYRWSARSAFGLFFFLGFVPVTIYSARSSLTVPISQGLKHVFLPLALMLLVAYLLDRNSRSGLTTGAPPQSAET